MAVARRKAAWHHAAGDLLWVGAQWTPAQSGVSEQYSSSLWPKFWISLQLVGFVLAPPQHVQMHLPRFPFWFSWACCLCSLEKWGWAPLVRIVLWFWGWTTTSQFSPIALKTSMARLPRLGYSAAHLTGKIIVCGPILTIPIMKLLVSFVPIMLARTRKLKLFPFHCVKQGNFYCYWM